ncbi:cell division protein FtsA [Emticicia sp. CRIBPO]|uniref:cell division protein FtsA n=1 Tax=Emticicia sp. CRIBPO TaxID=2683258 RepID=UPI001413212B|nr:cell division protein FtsA [Emticicia sp. CRIBPO]NBA87286.1 cell division protein FtsA [Emticicia sp. CRIBPO]
MTEENLVVGVDIGTSKICAAAGVMQKNDVFKIKGFVERNITPEDEALFEGEIVNASKTIEIIDEVLDELAENLELDLESININISNLDIQGHYHKGKVTKIGDNKQIHQHDVEKLIEDVRLTFKPQPGRVMLHCLPQDFTVNDIKVNEKIVGRFGVQVGGDFYFISARNESLENLYYTIKNVKAKVEGQKSNPPLGIESVLLSPIADSFLLLDHTIEDKRAGVALVNIGADLTEVIIFHKNGMRHFVSFPIAGNAISRDLMEAFNIQFHEAERLKKLCGNIPSSSINPNEVLVIDRKEGLAPVEILLKNASLVTEWRLKEIAAIVKSEIVRSGYDGVLTNGIILTGGTSSMAIIKDIFSDVCKIKSIRKGRINRNIDFTDFENLKKPKYSTVLGLMLSAYVDFDNRVDNTIFKHAPIAEPVPDHDKLSAVKKTVRDERKIREQKSKSLFDRVKDFMKDEDMNDRYEK